MLGFWGMSTVIRWWYLTSVYLRASYATYEKFRSKSSSFVFLYYCVFLVVVFAPNQLGLISCPSLFRRTNNIANLHNPLIGAMTWSGRITTKSKSSFSALVFCLFWHSFPFSVWSFIFWIKTLTASEAERRWGLVIINIAKFTWSVDFLR